MEDAIRVTDTSMEDASSDVASANRSSRPRGVRRQGPGQACAYCRHRKMKCTGEKPRCKNCEVYGKDCEYAQPNRRTRPTNAIVKQLRQENKQLREKIVETSQEASSTHSQTPTPSPASTTIETHSQVTSTTSGNSPETVRHVPLPVSAHDKVVSLSGSATYHGPTSTLYNSLPESSRQNGFTPEREGWMSRSLLAAAAQERHREVINARENNLDWDGVDPELGLHLLYLHWNRQHHAYLITYRPAFMRDMACNGPYFSKLLLNAIMYGASKFSPRLELRKDPADVRTAGWKFRNRVRDLLGQALDHSSITTIQALLQMSNSLFALGDEQSAAWIYAGTAFRMIVDLGLHLDVTKLPDLQRFSEEDIEIRRRVYWAGFVVDKMQSLYQGRPASLQANDVPIRFLDEYEELEHWQPYAYTSGSNYAGHPSYSVSTFTQLCRLCIILTDVLNTIYQSRNKTFSDDVLEQLNWLESRIKSWHNDMPNHLRLNLSDTVHTAPPPHVLSLLVMGAVLRILLHRPFVADGHLHSASPEIAHTSLAACAEAATTILKVIRVYDSAFGIRKAPYLICYGTYVAATIHARIAASRGSSSEAYINLYTCLSVFDQNAETNYAAKKAGRVIRNLMQSMGIVINDTTSGHAQTKSMGGTSIPPTSNSASASATLPQSIHMTEPTFVSGSFAPEIDVDAIIQSFWNVDQARNHTSDAINSGMALPTTMESNQAQINTAANWNTTNDTNDYNMIPAGMIEDNLFGFNTSDLDFIYGHTHM